MTYLNVLNTRIANVFVDDTKIEMLGYGTNVMAEKIDQDLENV